MLAASPVVPSYRCPGETYDIPHPVHLARLAAGYARCRDCLHRDGRVPVDGECGTTSSQMLADSGSRSQFTAEGVRGVYLNELTRTEAGKIAGAFASCLWDELASTGDHNPIEKAIPDPNASRQPSTGDEGVVVLAPGRPGPTVVLAHDERPASPDLVMGVGIALRRMGCQVIDVGPATRPAFWFAVDHLQAAGGIHVTGSGCDAAWTGLDFVRHGVSPCSRGGGLDQIESRYRHGYGRPSRRPGSQRLFTAGVAYEAGLGKHFHALRPLRIALGCPNAMLHGMLTRLFRKSACRLLPIEIPTRARVLDDPRDPDVLRVAGAVRPREAHFGILIDDDAQRCALFDNTGACVAPLQVLSLLADHEFDSRGTGRIIWEGAAHSAIPTQTEVGPTDGATTLAGMSLALREPRALCGADASGRHWFVESYPVCDAVLTLVKLLHVLSRSDAPFSDLLRTLATDATASPSPE
jgi:phosphomannomutase